MHNTRSYHFKHHSITKSTKQSWKTSNIH